MSEDASDSAPVGEALPVGYVAFVDEIKERIRSSQMRAMVAVNRELVLLYWHIGQEILTRQRQLGWGAKVIDRLAADLRHAFPELKGFSARNLKVPAGAGGGISGRARLCPYSSVDWVGR